MLINPRIHNVPIDGGIFQREASAREISGVPTIYMSGEMLGKRRSNVEELGASLQDPEINMRAALLVVGRPKP